MSVEAQPRQPLVALSGNPNAGKTSLFNALTGLHQKVGNYPGVTVERHMGTFKVGDQVFDCMDVPGLYSLIPMSEDEVIAVNALQGQNGEPKPDVIVCVVDATNLERNIYFYAQLAQLDVPVVVALTMVDMLARSGIELNLDELKSRIGVPVVTVLPHKNQGIGSLKYEIQQALQSEPPNYSALPEPAQRYEWAAEVTKSVLKIGPASKLRATTDKIDRILTHRFWGMLVFIGVMYLMFQSIYTLAGPLMDGIDWLFGSLKTWASGPLSGTPWLESLVTEGIIGGIGSVAIFLPQILILFLFISALEGSGYLARASFLMDRALGWCGLNGKAFIPLLSSFACAIPGIMAARIMPDQKSRLVTILVAPLMSCSARLPVYILLIGAVIEPRFGPGIAGLTLFGMHLVGLVVAIALVLIFNRKLLRGGQKLPFLMELPPYQWPKWKLVAQAVLGRAQVFVQTAGTIIVAMSILIWALLYFPRSEQADAVYRTEFARKDAANHKQEEREAAEQMYVDSRRLEDSILGRTSRFVAPVFAPAGFDWRVTTAILAAFPAREVMISSLGIIFDLGGEVDEGSTDLRQALVSAKHSDGKPLLTPASTFGLMVFFALCCQCMSTLAIIKRETNSTRWPVFVFFYMTVLAWVFAVLINQIGSLLAR